MKTILFGLMLWLALGSSFSFAQQEPVIHWPPGYSKEKASFYVENRIEILAPPIQVWEELIRAESWQEWYTGASELQILDSISNGILLPDSQFSWKTMGLDFRSEVREYEEGSSLSWISIKKSIQAYHGWLLIPTTSGCLVVTAESQNGWLTVLEKLFQPKKLFKQHEDWLQQLKTRVEHKNRALAIQTEILP